MADIFENPLTCKEREELVASPACLPPDLEKQVRLSKKGNLPTDYGIRHVERPRYGHDY